MSFKELLLQVKQAVSEAVEHQNYPIDVLYDQLHPERGENEAPLYQTVVLLENIHRKQYAGSAAGRLLFAFKRNEAEIGGTVEYDPAVYTRSGVERLLAHFGQLLEQALLQIGARLNEL
ncbi:condensation domain-containing protein, partial [Paenibacillus elgii]